MIVPTLGGEVLMSLPARPDHSCGL